MSAWPATGDTIPLVRARTPPTIWRRPVILHNADASSVERMSGENLRFSIGPGTLSLWLSLETATVSGRQSASLCAFALVVQNRRVDLDPNQRPPPAAVLFPLFGKIASK